MPFILIFYKYIQKEKEIRFIHLCIELIIFLIFTWCVIRIAKCVYGSSDSGTSGHFYSTTEPFWLAWRYWSFKNTLSLLPPFIENLVSLSILLISSFYYCAVHRHKIMSNCRQVLFQSAAISASGSIQFLSLAFRLKNRRNFPLSTNSSY